MVEHVTEGCLCEGKKCNGCEKIKCHGNFYRNGKRLRSECKVCILAKRKQEAATEEHSAKRKARYHANPEKYRLKSRQWREEHPGYSQRLNHRYYHSHKEEQRAYRKAQYLTWDEDKKKQEGERIKAYYQAHPEKQRERHVKYYSKNVERVNARVNAHRKAYPERYHPKSVIRHQNRRARKTQAGGSYTLQEWQSLKAKYDFTCLCCGRKEPEIKLTADHVIPVSKYGTSNIENIQPLCLSCNVRKHNKTTDYRR